MWKLFQSQGFNPGRLSQKAKGHRLILCQFSLVVTLKPILSICSYTSVKFINVLLNNLIVAK